MAGVVLADFLDGAVANEVEGRAASRTECVEVEAGQMPPVLSPVVPVRLVAVVPDGVDFSGHATQERGVFVFDADAQRFVRCSAHACIIQIVIVEFKGAEVCQRWSTDFSFLPTLKDGASRKGFSGENDPAGTMNAVETRQWRTTNVWKRVAIELDVPHILSNVVASRLSTAGSSGLETYPKIIRPVQPKRLTMLV